MARSKRSHPSVGRLSNVDEVSAAYARVENDLDSIPAELVGKVTADVPTAVSLALGALPRIESLLPALKQAFSRPPLEELGRLRERAFALLHTHLRWMPRSKALETDLEEARALREQLLAAADAHVKFGQMDADAVAQVREGSGHLDRANDLIALAALFRTAWPELGSRTPVSETQLRRASELGTMLVGELGGKALGLGASSDRTWSDRRNRAFRLFIRDYEQLRRAVQYVRYDEGDADAYAPPLHVRRRGALLATEESDVEEPGGGEDPAAPPAEA